MSTVHAAGIDDWITGRSTLAGGKGVRITCPRKIGKFLAERLQRQLRKMKKQVIRELAPGDL